MVLVVSQIDLTTNVRSGERLGHTLPHRTGLPDAASIGRPGPRTTKVSRRRHTEVGAT
jgi:hypothetical protein